MEGKLANCFPYIEKKDIRALYIYLSKIEKTKDRKILFLFGAPTLSLSKKNFFFQRLCCENTPSARYKHSATIVSSQESHFMLVFGGYSIRWLNELYVLNLERKVWWQPVISGSIPTPREGHTGELAMVFAFFNGI